MRAARFFFAAGARRRGAVFFLRRVRGKFTHSLAHPLQKDIPGPGRVFFGLQLHELTHSLAARHPEHPQQKSTHNKKTRVPISLASSS